MASFASFDDYPVVLQAKHIKNILGLSTGSTYELLKSEGFPTVFIGGKRMVVPKDDFIGWLKDSRRRIKRKPIILR